MLLGALSVVALVAACASHAHRAGPRSGAAASRCTANRDAGTITYLTGYQFQASASILAPVAADGLGYFRDLCLTVALRPGTGDTGVNSRLVAAGTVQLSDVGSESDLLVARAHGVDVVGVATYGHVPADTLLTMPATTDLKQLEGHTLGQKGILPPSIDAMLVAAGVDVGRIKQVKVGFDPSVLPRGQVQALTAYKSNEPLTLADRGTTVRQWDPERYGVVGSFGTVIANRTLLTQHPQAVQDFLRASLHAYAYCQDHVDQCVHFAAQRSSPGFDEKHNQAVWQRESALVASSAVPGKPLGVVDTARTAQEAQVLVSSGQLSAVPDLGPAFDAAPLAAIYDGSTLRWPGG